MANSDTNPGSIALNWWSKNIKPRENSSAKALSARLRRAATLDALCEPAVHELYESLQRNSELKRIAAERISRLVCLLAEVRDHNKNKTLAQCLGGGKTAVMSPLRFQKLMRVEGDELAASLRRAILMADCCCNVASLANDILYWGDMVRRRWCFHYYGSDVPGNSPV